MMKNLFISLGFITSSSLFAGNGAGIFSLPDLPGSQAVTIEIPSSNIDIDDREFEVSKIVLDQDDIKVIVEESSIKDLP